MLSSNIDASQGDGETEQRSHDAEITATVRSGHKSRGEREGRDLLIGALDKSIGGEAAKSTLCATN